MTKKLERKVAVVIGGGGQGCGRAVAKLFASENACVLVADVNESGAAETARAIESAGGRAASMRADAGIESEVRAVFAFAEKSFGGTDVLVHTASQYFPDDPLKHWQESVQTDFMGSVYSTLHGIEAMRRRGSGAIVHFGSTSALGHGRRHSPSPAYDVVKAALIRLTTTLAWTREKFNIRVNCIVPDWVGTPEVKAYCEALSPEQRKERGVPDVLLTLDEIAASVLQLATDESLAGRVLVCWCGQTPRLIPAGDPGYASLEDLPRI